MAVLMVGRPVEALGYPDGDPLCGSESDIKEATSLSKLLVWTSGLESESTGCP